MATMNHVGNPGLKIIDVSKKIDEKREKESRNEARTDPVRDQLEISHRKADMADLGATKKPPRGNRQDLHEKMKSARSALKEKLSQASKITAASKDFKKILEKNADPALMQEIVDALKKKVTEKQSGGQTLQAAAHEKLAHELLQAHADYQQVLAESVQGGFEQPSCGNPVVKSRAIENTEKSLLETLKKTLGAERVKHLSFESSDPDTWQQTLNDSFKKEAGQMKATEDQLKNMKKKTEARLKQAETVEEKQAMEMTLEVLNEEMETLLTKKQGMETSFIESQKLLENLAKLKVSQDLGLDEKEILADLGIQSAEEPEKQSKESKKTQESSSSPGKTSSVESATTSNTPDNTPAIKEKIPGSVSSDGVSSYVSPEEALKSQGLDLSGTALSILSTSQKISSDTKNTDKMIQQLLQAAMTGNWEAIKTALIILDRKAATITVAMGAQSVQAMQYYEKQQAQVSDAFGKLKQGPDYSAKLAQLNNDMNRYSLNRQSISNFLRDIMSMREEVGNLTNSVLRRDQQITSSLSRG